VLLQLVLEKKVWWKCKKGHEWQASIDNRNHGRGCPYCCNQKIGEDNNLKVTNPKLAKEWHPTKNGKLTPSAVFAGSEKKVWWKCKNGHEWQASIAGRNQGIGCPYCANKKTCKDNCLQTTNPELAKEWDYEKNGNITPDNVTAGSEKKVWWKCKKGHEWQAIVYTRNKGIGCPCCSGKKASKENNLLIKNPELAKEWHPTKNGKLTPSAVTAGSGKNVWWKCKKGHEWQASIYSRNHGTGCPYCANKRIGDKNNLLILNPELSKEWNYDKNGDLTPEKVGAGSSLKVWWKCKKGHEWQAIIYSRNSGISCPCCSGKKASKENNLLIKNPELAKEWHPKKNGKLTPNDVTANSGKEVWWKCKKGHEWQANIKSRNNGRGCPYCLGRKK